MPEWRTIEGSLYGHEVKMIKIEQTKNFENLVVDTGKNQQEQEILKL